MESLFGFGMMAGPLIGGVLYKYGGFCLPFVVIGSTMVVCYITALIIVKPKQKNGPVHCEATNMSGTKFSILLIIPQVGISIDLKPRLLWFKNGRSFLIITIKPNALKMISRLF